MTMTDTPALPFPAPDEAPAHHRARAGQPDTSRRRAEGTDAERARRASILHRVGSLLRAAGDRGMTDDELAAACVHLTDRRHSVATRRNAWVRAGYVVNSGLTRPNELGNPCTVWRWDTDTPSAQAGTPPIEGARRAARRGATTAGDDTPRVVAVRLVGLGLNDPEPAHCPVCGHLEGRPHWAGCPNGIGAALDAAAAIGDALGELRR